MSIKSAIQTFISTKLANGSSVLASEHREVENELLDNFYPNVVTVDQASTSIITLNPALSGIVTYTANIYKQGRTVTMVVCVNKNTTSLFSGYIFEITNSEYLGFPVTPAILPSTAFIGIANFLDNSYSGHIDVNNKFNTVIDGGTKQFTITYQTLN